MPPENRIDTDQRGVLDKLLRAKGHHWIRGFAGSGKSVVLIQSLRELLVENPNASACIVAFTHSLKDMLRTGLPDSARDIPVVTYHEFKGSPTHYDYIFVDEVQDLELGILHLLKANCSALIMAGDEEQSIYQNGISPADIKAVNPAIHSLSRVHRLTEKLRKVVATILPQARIMEAQNARQALDVKITQARANSTVEERAWVWREAKKFASSGNPVAILLPKQRMIQDFITSVCDAEGIPAPEFPLTQGRYKKTDYKFANEYLAKHGIILRYLGNNYGDLEEAERMGLVFLMTYHSSKGLDFETVFIPEMDASLNIWRGEDAMERKLFYVAATRSRRNLFISYSGSSPHRLVEGIPRDLTDNIDIKPQSSDENDDEFNNVF